jgi:hypothetical protein
MSSARQLVGVLLAVCLLGSCAILPRAESEDEAERRIAREFRDHCKKVLCRERATARARIEDGRMIEAALPESLPFVLPDGLITIVQGETVYLELDVADGEVRGVRAVPAIANPRITAILRLWQEPGRADSYFSVVQPFERTLKYRLGIMVPNRRGVLATSSCPVAPGLTMIEHWPQPIFQLVMKDLRFVSKDDRLVCEK